MPLFLQAVSSQFLRPTLKDGGSWLRYTPKPVTLIITSVGTPIAQRKIPLSQPATLNNCSADPHGMMSSLGTSSRPKRHSSLLVIGPRQQAPASGFAERNIWNGSLLCPAFASTSPLPSPAEISQSAWQVAILA